MLFDRQLFLRAFLSVLLPVAAGTARAGVSLYLEGIPGENTHPARSNWVEGVGFSIQTATVGSELTLYFEKPVDAASPLLGEAVARSAPVSKGILELTRTVGHQQRFFQLKLYDLVLLGLSTVATNGATGRPTERLRLSSTKVEWTYIQYDPRGVNLAVGDSYAWWDWIIKVGGTESSERDTDGDGTPDWADDDADNDGMPNVYEVDSKLLPTVDDALDDPDGDGMGSRDEYWSGTHPADSGSVFRISRLDVGEGAVRVTWTSEAGRSYDLFTGNKPDAVSVYLGSYPSQGPEISADFKASEVGLFFRVTTPVVAR